MQSAVRLFSEKRFHLKFAGKRLSGVVDRLYQRPDKSWVVVDFKTRSAGAPPEQGQAHQGDRLQVELYLWAMSRILETRRISGLLFFTATGETIPIGYDPDVEQRCEELLRGLPGSAEMEFYPLTTQPQLCRSCGFRDQGLCHGLLPESGQRDLFSASPHLPDSQGSPQP